MLAADVPPLSKVRLTCVSSGFRREVAARCALRRCYAASIRNSLTTFRHNRSHQGGLKMGQIDCAETSVRNYHYALRNSPEEHSSLRINLNYTHTHIYIYNIQSVPRSKHTRSQLCKPVS